MIFYYFILIFHKILDKKNYYNITFINIILINIHYNNNTIIIRNNIIPVYRTTKDRSPYGFMNKYKLSDSFNINLYFENVIMWILDSGKMFQILRIYFELQKLFV